MKLKTPLEITLPNYIVNLSRTQYATGTPATLVGWGLNATGGVVMTTLQRVDLQIYNYADCQARHNPGWLFYTNTCAGVDAGGKGQCSGKTERKAL